MSLKISIVSFNTKEMLKNLLEDLDNQNKSQDFKIVVVDNNSRDGSIEMLEEKFKNKIQLIKNSENMGFAKAQNIVLKDHKADYFLVLNPDIKLDKGVINDLLGFMKENPKCGVLSCKILGFNGGLHSNGGDFPTGLPLLNWLFNLDFLGGGSFHRKDKEYFEKPHEVDWVGGTIMLIKKEVLEKVGGFNEDYFMYFEDVEFCYRAKKSGFEVWIDPEVSIKHKSGASSEDPRFRQWLGEFRGLIHFHQDNLGIRILVYKAIILRILAYSLFGKFNYAKTYAKVFINI